MTASTTVIPQNARSAAQHDLTPRIAQFLDRHLVLPLLEVLLQKDIYPEADILNAQYDLLITTKMVDFANSIYQKIHQNDSVNMPDFEQKRKAVLAEMERLAPDVQEIEKIISDPEIVSQLKQDKQQNIAFLKENYGYKPELLQSFFQYASLLFQTGQYAACAEMLYHIRVLSLDNGMIVSSFWGKLASEILSQNWDSALEDIRRLSDLIESRHFASAAQQLMARTWLIHWSLFVYFNHPKGRDLIVDVFFQPAYITTISKECPWILRYLTTAVVVNKRRRNMMKELVKVIEIESYQYRDPVTEFVENLYVKLDFEAAQEKLKECEQVLLNDFFIASTVEDFVEAARLFIFETYCRIHQNISIPSLSKKLNLSPEEGEKWVVNLIRQARLDAKIDAANGTIHMGNNFYSSASQQQHQFGADSSNNTKIGGVYQAVIEKTKALNFRTTVLMSNIEKREADPEGHRRGMNAENSSSLQGAGKVRRQ